MYYHSARGLPDLCQSVCRSSKNEDHCFCWVVLRDVNTRMGVSQSGFGKLNLARSLLVGGQSTTST